MAVTTDPLRRDTIQVVARDTGDRFAVGNSDPALRLAGALADLVPTINGAAQSYIANQRDEQGVKAKKAAIETSGAALADAVRDGKLKATQNPFFIQAYNTEAAAVSGRASLSQLQLDSQTWEERNDPQAFAKRWGDEVAKVGEQYTGVDQSRGFAAVAGQASQQVLATNQSYNSQRIEAERVQNQSSLLATDITQRASANGGVISAAQLGDDLKASFGTWHGTGGSNEGWNTMVAKAVTSAAYQSHNPELIDLLKDPALTSQYLSGGGGSYMGFSYTHAGADTNEAMWDKREDGSAKGHGFLGLLQRPGGGVSSEISIGVDGSEVGSKKAEVEIPTMVPTLSKDELSALLSKDEGWVSQSKDPLASSIRGKARAFASERIAAGLDPFASREESPDLQSSKLSIYAIAGVADAAESDRYRISQAADYAATGRLRAIETGLKVKGQQGLSDLYSNYGTAITLGNVSVQDMNTYLVGKGYSAQEAAASISAVGQFTSGIASAQTARLTINSTDPGQSAQILDLTNEALTTGYSKRLADKVKALVLSGDLKRDDATGIISKAMGRSEHFESEDRADTRQAASDARRNQAEQDSKDVKALRDLHQKALNVGARAARNVTVIQGRGTYAPPALAKEAQQVSVAAAQGWLATKGHETDYNGASIAAFDAAEAWGHGKTGKRASKPSSSGRR